MSVCQRWLGKIYSTKRRGDILRMLYCMYGNIKSDRKKTPQKLIKLKKKKRLFKEFYTIQNKWACRNEFLLVVLFNPKAWRLYTVVFELILFIIGMFILYHTYVIFYTEKHQRKSFYCIEKFFCMEKHLQKERDRLALCCSQVESNLLP